MTDGLKFEHLSKDFAAAHVDELVPLLGLASPDLQDPEYLLTDATPEGIPLYAKWRRSWVVSDGNNPVAVAEVHERPAEPDTPYDKDQLYIGALGIREDYQKQRIGSRLGRRIIDQALAEPLFEALAGPIRYVGTTVHASNVDTLDLARSFGLYTLVGKDVPLRGLHHVMRARVDEIVESPMYRVTRPEVK